MALPAGHRAVIVPRLFEDLSERQTAPRCGQTVVRAYRYGKP